jgi:hypothetical protein
MIGDLLEMLAGLGEFLEPLLESPIKRLTRRWRAWRSTLGASADVAPSGARLSVGHPRRVPADSVSGPGGGPSDLAAPGREDGRDAAERPETPLSCSPDSARFAGRTSPPARRISGVVLHLLTGTADI